MAPNSLVPKSFLARLFVLLPLVASAIPPLLIVATVARYGVDVPFWDQWGLVDFLSAAREGQLGFQDLWPQHNEHRIVFPLAVMLALARATDWNVRYEMAANVVVALGLLGMLAPLLRRTVKPMAPSLTPLG